MTLRFRHTGGTLDLRLGALVVAGWTARDEAAVRHHVEELAALGVAPPSTFPLYYRASASLATFADAIEVVGEGTSGEAEPLLVVADGRRWLGLGSDHTDRALEAHSVALSKQACPKPLNPELWAWDEVEDHLDALELGSWIDEGAGWTRYQEGTLASVRPLDELARGAGDALGPGARARGAAAMLCGTLPAIGGVRPANAFRMALHDPVRGRTLEHEYRVRALPVVA